MRINFEYLHYATGEDKELEKELFLVLYQTVNEIMKEIQELRAVLEEQSQELIRKKLHKLKGCAANIGAEDLAAICLDGEHKAEAKQMREEDLSYYTTSIYEEFEQVMNIVTDMYQITPEDIENSNDPMAGI